MADEERPQAGRGEPSRANTGTTYGRDRLAVELGAVARELQRIDDPVHLLQDAVLAAIELVPGSEGGSIADVIARRRIEHKAASSDLVRQVDLLMQATGQGPCLDAVWEQQTVRVADTVDETRWPEFTQRAADAGVRSMLCFQLFVADSNLGALNLYSSRPEAFTDESEHVGLLVAAHAAIAYAGIQKQAQLQTAIDPRGLIGQAIGILTERYHITGLRALAVLTRYSQQSNRKLRDVAAEIVLDADAGSIR